MIEWNRIETVFLDMDGTILDLRFDNHFWLEHLPMRYAQRNQMSLDASKAYLFPKMHALRGQLDWYCTDFWTQTLSVPIIEFKREVVHLIQLRRGALAFLRSLREANKAIILFTNAHEDAIVLKMQETGIASEFDEIISSHQLGLAKEADGVWQKLRNHVDFEPQRSVFIDDNFSVLDRADIFGVYKLFGIARPDSKGASLSHERYTLLDSFSQIMPV